MAFALGRRNDLKWKDQSMESMKEVGVVRGEKLGLYSAAEVTLFPQFIHEPLPLHPLLPPTCFQEWYT